VRTPSRTLYRAAIWPAIEALKRFGLPVSFEPQPGRPHKDAARGRPQAGISSRVEG
jgi:biotin operon repressor